MLFYNRTRELGDIARTLSSNRSELVIIYGRRGVGKSTLLAEALAQHPHFFYQATTRTLTQQLEDITAALRSFAPELVIPGTLPALDALLDTLAQLARSRPESRLIAVIDELPYLAQADSAVPSVLQKWWDGVRRSGLANLKLFLLGSMVSWMEEHTLSERGALYNRRTGQIKLEPLGYNDAALFYPKYSPYDRISAYAVWGGMPSYLDEIDPALGLWQNVERAVLWPGTRLSDEPQWLRFTDLRNDAIYSSVLRAIALGHHRPSKIATAVGKSRADDVKYHLDRLCDLRLVERVAPVHEQHTHGSKHSLYLLADHYVAFWYRYVDRLRHLLGLRKFDTALRQIQADFDKYVSEHVFEDVCRQYIWRAFADGALPAGLEFDTVGPWWNSREGDSDEIDVVALHDGRAVLVGECKWSNQKAGMRELAGIQAALFKAQADLHPADRLWRAVFSRSGFEPDLVDLAADPAERVLLVSPADLYA